MSGRLIILLLTPTFYQKELIKGLEEISKLKSEPQLYKALNEVLIYRNFNKKKYLYYFTGKIAGKVNSFAAVKDKLDQLLLSYKENDKCKHSTDENEKRKVNYF